MVVVRELEAEAIMTWKVMLRGIARKDMNNVCCVLLDTEDLEQMEDLLTRES